jgi:hypothetical protein
MMKQRSLGMHVPGSYGPLRDPRAWRRIDEQLHGQGCGRRNECTEQPEKEKPKMDERNFCENMARPGLQAAVRFPGCLGREMTLTRPKIKATAGNQNARRNTDYGIAQQVGQAPKPTISNQLGEHAR